VIPQSYPMKIWLEIDGESPAVTVPVVGWEPVPDPIYGRSVVLRYVPVVVVPGDHRGAWIMPSDGDSRWGVVGDDES
jgi:hypothetical protein